MPHCHHTFTVHCLLIGPINWWYSRGPTVVDDLTLTIWFEKSRRSFGVVLIGYWSPSREADLKSMNLSLHLQSRILLSPSSSPSAAREREREREKTNWFQHTHYAQPLFCVFDTPSIFFTVSRLLWPIDSFFLSFSLSHQSSFIRFAVDDRWRIIFCPVHCFSFSSSTPVQATISLLFALFTAAVYDDDKRDEWMVHSFPLSLSLY